MPYWQLSVLINYLLRSVWWFKFTHINAVSWRIGQAYHENVLDLFYWILLSYFSIAFSNLVSHLRLFFYFFSNCFTFSLYLSPLSLSNVFHNMFSLSYWTCFLSNYFLHLIKATYHRSFSWFSCIFDCEFSSTFFKGL